MINWENYEEYMMMHADGELQPHEAEALEAFIDQHPQLRSEMAAYERTHMAPDMAQVYEHKAELLKPEPAGRRIAFIPNLRSYGIAAGVAALIVIGFFAMQDRNTKTAEVAKLDATGKQQTPKMNTRGKEQVMPIPANPAPVTNDIAQVNTTPAPGDNRSVHAHSHVSGHDTHKSALAQHNQLAHADNTNTAQRAATDQLEALNGNTLQKLPVNNVAGNQLQPVAVQEYAATNKETQRTSWIDKLPISDDKKEKLANVANTLAGGAAQASNIKETIADKSLSIRVERRKLIFSF